VEPVDPVEPVKTDAPRTGAAGRPRSSARAGPTRSDRQGRSDRSDRCYRCYRMGRGASERAVLAALRERFEALPQPRRAASVTWLDTFDGRLHARGLRLAARSEGDALGLELVPASGADARAGARSQSVAKLPSFAVELPEGALRRELVALAGPRRLLPRVLVDESVRPVRLLDDQRKTVAHAFFERAGARDPSAPGASVRVPATLRVRAVRGFHAALGEVDRALAGVRGLEPTSDDPAARALRALGREPGGLSGRPRVELEPGEPAAAAGLALQRALLEVVRANEDGVRRDLDPEHLHDLRVAVRRSRTLHRALRGHWPADAAEAAGRALRWLGRITGPTRDLDVQLEELASQRRRLPETESAALEPLAAHLRERRGAAWRALVAELDGPDYARALEELEAFADPAGAVASGAARDREPVGALAAHRIERAWRRLRRRGRAVGEGAPDADLHRLRLDGKRLRYLLELFRSLLPPAEAARLVKRLKKLQDSLGDFHDAAVQEELLRAAARDLAGRRDVPAETLLAVGRLVERLERKRERLRPRILRRLAEFEEGPGARKLRRVLRAPARGAAEGGS